PLRILLAEDHAVNQKVALRLLAGLGHTADVVTNGREALEASARARYDVILMDVQMPEMDGLTATRALRSGAGEGERPWIVALTAGALAADIETCRQAGMDDFVAKPVTAAALARALERGAAALERSAATLAVARANGSPHANGPTAA